MQHSVEILGREIDRRHRQPVRRSIDRTIKRAAPLHCAPHQRLDLIFLKEVGANRTRVAAAIDDTGGHSLTALLAPTCDDNRRSQPAKPSAVA